MALNAFIKILKYEKYVEYCIIFNCIHLYVKEKLNDCGLNYLEVLTFVI